MLFLPRSGLRRNGARPSEAGRAAAGFSAAAAEEGVEKVVEIVDNNL